MLFSPSWKQRLVVASRSLALMILAMIVQERPALLASESKSLRFGLDGADLSLMTDLWRSAFGHSGDRIEQQSDDKELSGAVQHNRDTNTATSELEQADTISSDLPIASTEETLLDESPVSDLAMMSDWETSESQAVADREKTFTKEGPSAVTAIVAIVGFIVVGGAYLSGRK